LPATSVPFHPAGRLISPKVLVPLAAKTAPAGPLIRSVQVMGRLT